MGEQRMTITLNGSDLSVPQVMAAARHGETVALAPEAIAAMRVSRAVVQDVLAGGEPVYGLTTGVGERKAYLLDPAERQRFNHRMVLNHRIAQGDVAPADVVRGAMLCLANSYAKGVTGVRPELAEMIVTLLNEGFAPPVRRLGSLGQGTSARWPTWPTGSSPAAASRWPRTKGSPWSAATRSLRRAGAVLGAVGRPGRALGLPGRRPGRTGHLRPGHHGGGPGRGDRVRGRGPGHRPARTWSARPGHRPRLPDGQGARPVHPGRRHAAGRPGTADRAGDQGHPDPGRLISHDRWIRCPHGGPEPDIRGADRRELRRRGRGGGPYQHRARRPRRPGRHGL